MKRFLFISAIWILASCINQVEPFERPSDEPPFELTAAGLAGMFASLPMEPAHLREVYDAVGHSSGNGYDEEYTLDSLLLRPGAGVGPRTRAASSGYDRPLRELVRDFLSSRPAATRSGVDDLMDLIASSGYQLYWPYSDSWDGESYPVITFDPGYGAESNYGYELAPGPSGAVIADTLEVTEAMAMTRPVWVVNSNSDAAFTPLELFARAPSKTAAAVFDNYPPAPPGDGGKVPPETPLCRPSASGAPLRTGAGADSVFDDYPPASLTPAIPAGSRPRKLLLRSFKMLRNYDSWFGGASEFFVKCGCVDGFSASTDAEIRAFSPNVTDFMIVVKRRDLGRDIPYEAIMVTNFTSQMDNIAFFIMEDDGGTRTNWKCDLTVKIQSKSYGVTVDIPYNEKDDIVWRGQLSRQFFEEEDVVYGRFGDVSCSFELE